MGIRRCRRGYRLFRRIFSAADNYYAVPFPPLETLKFKEDDDGQWEDLEIYVASHKGLVSLKPQPKGHPEKSRQLKGIAKSSNSAMGRQQQIINHHQKQPQAQQLQQHPMQQLQDRRQANDFGRAKIDQSNNRLMKRGRAGLTQQQQQQSSSQGKGAANDAKRRYGSLQQQHQQQQQQQQQQQPQQRFQRGQLSARRADPSALNAGRLLSQLNPATPDEDPHNDRRASVGGTGGGSCSGGAGGSGSDGPVPSYMKPYSPLQRARWPIGGGGGGRCGRLAARPPADSRGGQNARQGGGGCNGS